MFYFCLVMTVFCISSPWETSYDTNCHRDKKWFLIKIEKLFCASVSHFRRRNYIPFGDQFPASDVPALARWTLFEHSSRTPASL